MAQRSRDIIGTDKGETGLMRTDADVLSADEAKDGTENIKARIEETRADMGETIDAIQERLSLAHISEQVSEQVSNVIGTAKHTVYDATVGKMGNFMTNTGRKLSNSPVVETVRENPLPFVLIGVGAGLLAYKSFSKRGNDSVAGFRPPKKRAGEMEDKAGIVRSAQGGLRKVKDTVANAAGTAYDGVTRVAGSAIDGVTGAASSTYAGAGDLAHRAIEKAGDIGTKAHDTYNHYLEEKPWAIGAVAFVAGAAIGMAIPSTRYEGKFMGEARVNLLNKVQETASEFVDKAKHAADEAKRATTGEA